MDTFYLQDSRSYLGNSMLWWGKENGYTTDLQHARVFTRDEALKQHQTRETDIPWPTEYIAEHMQLTVDMQYVRRSHLKNYDIELLEPKPVIRSVIHCPECGAFVSTSRMVCAKCLADLLD